MTNHTNGTVDRRSVLKSIGATGVAGLGGVTVLSGSAAAFSMDERVKVTPNAGLNTRHRPGVESRTVATLPQGAVGEIMNGPTDEDGYTWWGVHWLDANEWGWSAGQYLESTGGGGGGGGGGNADFTWPMSGYVTSPYGSRNGEFHSGVDVGHNGEIGTPIHAARGGVVSTGWDGDGYGNYIVIDHGDGYVTEYGHLNDFSVGEGERVDRGQQIGGMGQTGNSTGPHLHFTIEANGNPVSIPASDGETLTAGEAVPKDYSGI